MSSHNDYDYIILGAGPAGIQLGYYFQKNNENYRILESGKKAGTFFNQFPRHRKLISINKIHTGYDEKEVNLRWDWNSLLNDDDDFSYKDFDKDYFPSADTLVEYMNEYVNRYQIAIDYEQDVSRISREGKAGQFILETVNGTTYRCNKLIIATGFKKPNVPNIPGIEFAECYTKFDVAPEKYANKAVLIIGKGNSSFETADSLTPTASVIHVVSPETIQFAWETHYVGHLRAVNNNFLDTYQLKSQNALLDAFVESIEMKDGKYHVDINYLHANGERETLQYDHVINCTGFKFDDGIFDESIKTEMTHMNKFPLQTCEWESTNVKDMYFAGVLTHMRDYRKTTSGFIHGFRYNVRALHRILQNKYTNKGIEARKIDTDIESIIQHALKRINCSSALWQQFGFLRDVIDLNKGRYYEELPIDYAKEVYFKSCPHYLTVSLEFGKVMGNPFGIERNPVPDKANESVFLHPVIRQYVDGKLTAEHHILENLYGEWHDEESHIKPLRDFLTSILVTHCTAELEMS